METWLLLVLLLSLSPRGAAKAPIVAASGPQAPHEMLVFPCVKASGVCPKGFFRNATLLFPCDTRSGPCNRCHGSWSRVKNPCQEWPTRP